MPNPFGTSKSRAVGAALLAFFFAAFTLIAAAPHSHARSVSPCADKTPGLSPPVALAAPSCALCDWRMLPALPAGVAVFFLIVAALSFAGYAFPVVPQCAVPCPRRCPRGPPVFFIRIAAA